MKSESPSRRSEGREREGGSERLCSGMASDARIWDWIMQRKEPRRRVIGATAIWAGRKKELDITTGRASALAVYL